MTFAILSALLTLFLLESMLSIDNAAVLAVMVAKLPKDQQPKALRYGLLGAYVMRFGAMSCAVWLASQGWLMAIGGGYLLLLSYKYFASDGEDGDGAFSAGWAGALEQKIGQFWTTVALVEVADLVFSIDNVFAAAAMQKPGQEWMLYVGVGMGILAMRFVSQWFVALIERFPRLTTSAYVVIAILGLKLVLVGVCGYIPAAHLLLEEMHSETFDMWFSASMLSIFFVPVVGPLLRRKKGVTNLHNDGIEGAEPAPHHHGVVHKLEPAPKAPADRMITA